jgi:hypothetical protein
MWIPLELVNYIFFLADNPCELVYDYKRKNHVIRLIPSHPRFASVSRLYESCKTYTRQCDTYPCVRETQICFPAKQIPTTVANSTYNVYSMLLIIDECFDKKTEKNLVFSWNRYFVTENLNGNVFMTF